MAVDIGTTPAYDIPKDYTSGLADLLKEAKNIYEAKKGAGFQTYTAPRIAGFSPEELAAMGGIAGLVGSGQQYFAPAAGLTAGLAQQYTPATAQQYMSPYQQAVIDVEKREAIRQSQRPMQDISAAATQVGGMGGSRQAILEAEAQRNLQQQLGDIQTKGQQAAYETGLRAFESQKARERQAASGLTSLGQIAPKQSLAELTALSGIGEAQRAMQQGGLDIQYQDFLQQQQYPYDLLGQYQSTLYGYPYQAYAQQQYTPYQKPSTFQQLAGVLGAVGKVAGPSGFGFFNTGGKVAYQSENGLSGMIKKLQPGGVVGDEPIELLGFDESKPMENQISKASLVKSLLDMQKGLSTYGTTLRETMAEQQRIAKERQERLQKEASPINYISDMLLAYSKTDPRAGFGAQIGEATEVASGQRDIIQDEIDQLAEQVATGQLSQAEANLKMQQLQTETLSDVVDILGGSSIEPSEFNAISNAVYRQGGIALQSDPGRMAEITAMAVAEYEKTGDLSSAQSIITRELSKLGIGGLSDNEGESVDMPKIELSQEEIDLADKMIQDQLIEED